LRRAIPIVVLLAACSGPTAETTTTATTTTTPDPTTTTYPDLREELAELEEQLGALEEALASAESEKDRAFDTIAEQADELRELRAAAPTTTVAETTTTLSPDALTAPRCAGVFKVGVDIAPRVWKAPPDLQDCYWERTDANGDIIDNHFGPTGAGLEVNVSESDYQVKFDGCGEDDLPGLSEEQEVDQSVINDAADALDVTNLERGQDQLPGLCGGLAVPAVVAGVECGANRIGSPSPLVPSNRVDASGGGEAVRSRCPCEVTLRQIGTNNRRGGLSAGGDGVQGGDQIPDHHHDALCRCEAPREATPRGGTAHRLPGGRAL